ncbi:MAG TPA: spore protease YyaC [Clostridiales bacterium]|nr:spore protease YyaC [Clostridiales bacterium]
MEIVDKKIVVDVNRPYALSKFSEAFTSILSETLKNEYEKIIILCIGSDRSTGDCLGPLVGYKLGLIKYKDVSVYGNLNEPVHAKNLQDVIDQIYNEYENPFIIGIDASLGEVKNIGCISIGSGPLKPGAGIYKNLPVIGDMHITGTVNIGGFLEFMILQNTRLGLVMKMADIISNGIHYGIWKVILNSKLEGV